MKEKQRGVSSVDKPVEALASMMRHLGRKLPFITVAYMMLIFLVSSIPVDDSLPGRILMGILPSVQDLLHVPEYALLFCLSFFSLTNLGMNAKRARLTALFFCLAFAAADECYQYFIPGRQMSVGDWIADAVGVFAGFAVIQYYLAMMLNRNWA
jgi:VanZ family protein